VQAIGFARHIADRAIELGLSKGYLGDRIASDHIGAVLADTVLQAGLNYRNVVRPRVERIVNNFPQAAQLGGVLQVIQANMVGEFLLWKHSEKIGRFTHLANVLQVYQVDGVEDLRSWLSAPRHRTLLLAIPGIGPKSVDYLACLLGFDCIAVDRHVRAFASGAGIERAEYDVVKLATAYAADLLGISRRNFDAWIWNYMSVQRGPQKD
jgi:hypothetical protein